MTHSQYLLPGLPDLLKSHRLSYKKFLHNGIDEEFDLLSAKTDLNEEEIFYESLKLNHIDELSPSQAESLDYIYHAQEKIFLVPKRTLEDSLRGRQSHSFHLFIPLEVKILPFQDELDTSHFIGDNFLKSTENKRDTHKTIKKKQPTYSSGLQPSLKTFASNSTPKREEFSSGGSNEMPYTSEIFFRGGSGSSLSEIKKEFFKVALSFFFQQPKIQKIFITKRFLLLRWFCEKLQYIEPSLASDRPGNFIQSQNISQRSWLSDIEGETPSFSDINRYSTKEPKALVDPKLGESFPYKIDDFDLTFAKFDLQTKGKLYKVYQNILLRFEKQTKKRKVTHQLSLSKSSQKFSVPGRKYSKGSFEQNDFGTKHGKDSLANLDKLESSVTPIRKRSSRTQGSRLQRRPSVLLRSAKKQFKVFQKNSHWRELLNQIRVIIDHTGLPEFKANKAASKEDPNQTGGSKTKEFRSDSAPGQNPWTEPRRGYGRQTRFGNLRFSSRTPGPFGATEDPGLRSWTPVGAKARGRTLGSLFYPKFPDLSVQPKALGWSKPFFRGFDKNSAIHLAENTHILLPGFNFKISGLTAARKSVRQNFSRETESNAKFYLNSSRIRFGTIENTASNEGDRRSEKNKQAFSRRSLRSHRFSSKMSFLRRIVQAKKIKTQKKKLQEIFLATFPPISKKKGLRFWKLEKELGSPSLAPSKLKFLKHFKSPLQQTYKEDCNLPSGERPFCALRTILKLVSIDDQLVENWGNSPTVPSKFLSLPQNETGSLWKILPRKPFYGAPSSHGTLGSYFPEFGPKPAGFRPEFRGGRSRSPRIGFQCYQLHRLAYRQRNMFILHPENFIKSAQTITGKLEQQLTNETVASAPFPQNSPIGQVVLQGKSVPVKKILEKNLIFDRFFLKLEERQGLHFKKSLKLREKLALKIEKKSSKLQVLPGLEFWETSHSEKGIEEYWEFLLQPYRKKLPSKLLVSIPSGNLIFTKSEKDSRPKELKASIADNPRTWVQSSRTKAFQSSKCSFGSKNQMFWVLELVNMKFLMKKILSYSPAMLQFFWKHRFRFLWKALSESTSKVAPENLPKVCSDLRKLLTTFREAMRHEFHEPQKFFVSGQVGKKEWPFQKDSSKSYFALLNLGKMPFMTKQGHFLINGSGRVLVSQIAKCPNFYTKMKIDSRGRPRYWTEFVSSFKNAGEWIQFHIDLENKMFFSLGTKRKYSIFIFLGALGISPSEIPDVIEHWDFLKQSIHKEEILIDQNENFLTYLVEPLEVREARILFHDSQNYSFFPGGEKTDEELQKFFEDIFYNPSRYFLGHAGREALNQRRRFSGVPSRSRALEKEDFIAAINALIEVRLGLTPPDDIDHLKFRRVRLPGELLQNEFHLALDEIFTLDFTKFREGPLPGDALEPQPKDQRRTIFPTLYDLEQKIFEKGRPFAVSKTVGIQSTYQVSPLEKRMRNFFHTGQLSQYMDQTNPLAEITHKRRLTSLGPDGLPKQVGVAVRELHPSHFGRICPIETPEGLNAGLVASLSSQAKISSHHTLLAPYYWVKDATREFPQKIFHNEIRREAEGVTVSRGRGQGLPSESAVSLFKVSEVPLEVLKYPPVLPEVIFLSAAAEDSVYICSEDYWFSSKYKNFETITHSAALQGVENPPGSGTEPKISEARLPESTLGKNANRLQIDSKNSLVKFQTVFPARYQQEFFTVTKSQIDFFGICPTQMISVGTSLIPFLEHDDANRALMGSNMQRQALPLLVLERPLVGTGSEKGVAQSSNSVLLSEFSGQVSFVDGRKVVIDSFPKKITSFPETLNTKNARLLLGNFVGYSELGFSSAFQVPPTSVATGHEGNLNEVLDYNRRNLFQNFQNRTEDGNVKIITRIFSVKIQAKTDPNSKVFTSVKVFPISDEEYEKSRNLLRREFLKKYKEIQNKKVFPLDFWPGERWKKTDELSGQKIEEPQNSRNYVDSPQELKRIRSQKSNLSVPSDGGLPTSPPFPAFGTPPVQDSGNLRFSSRTPEREMALRSVVFQGKKILPSMSSRVRKLFETKSPAVSKLILQKKTLRRSMLPVKAGRLFFEPTPQMIFKNILSKNLKKREILRKAFLQTAFIPQNLEFQNSPEGKLDTNLLKTQQSESSQGPGSSSWTPTGPGPWTFGRQRRFGNLRFSSRTPTGLLSKGARARGHLDLHDPRSSSLAQRETATNKKDQTPFKPEVQALDLNRRFPKRLCSGKLTLSRSKMSWSVSMKKVTPYTQITYNIQGYWRTNQNTLRRQRPSVQAGDWVAAGDLLADSSATLRGELCVGQNILVGYVPWEGYNFEDAIVVNERLVEEDIYTSILVDRYEMEAAIDAGEKITRKIPDIKPHLLKNLDIRGIICVGTWVEEDDILVGKILPVTTELQGYSKLLADIYQIAPPVAKDVSFRVPDRISGRVLECSVSEMIVRTPDNQSFATPWKVTLYLVEKRRMKLGDKMSGRHGNKGIVSIILPPQDMPFLPDGTPLDVALNPLGVPSRMNVGQLLESLLGLAGKHLHQKYRIPAFDEMYGEDFSRRIVYDKLLEASQKTQKPWLFNPNFPGKMMLRDGRTGEYFHQPILVGYPYMLKLIHMVDDKMHARATGPYTMVTQQPLKGRANRGGQRIGEMEVWAIEAFAASYALQELLTLKSDDISGRNHFLMSFLKRKKRTIGGIPDAFRVLMHELQSLCFHVHYTEDYRLTYPTLLESSNIPETPVPGNYGRGS